MTADVDTGGLQALSRRLVGLLALAGKEADHEVDRAWWAARLLPAATEQAEGIRSKWLAGYAAMEERWSVGTAEGQARLRRLRSYTWRRSPYAGRVGGMTYRTVSTRSPAGSWIYPPIQWIRRRLWRTKRGALRQRVSMHATPARDLKPALLRGRAYVVIPLDRQQRRGYVPKRTGYPVRH